MSIVFSRNKIISINYQLSRTTIIVNINLQSKIIQSSSEYQAFLIIENINSYQIQKENIKLRIIKNISFSKNVKYGIAG